MSKHLYAFAAALLIGAACHAAEPPAANWAQWRGPEFAGSATSGSYPVEWSDDRNLTWKVELPGRGCSTPVVWEEQIFVTAPIDGNDGVVSLDFSGKSLWQTALGPERPAKNRRASGCNPSPVTDGKLIFVYFKSGTLAALDFRGNALWKTDLQKIFGQDQLWWDVGTSPVLTDEHVVGTVMHGGRSGLVAFDKRTGNLAWKADRNYPCPKENHDGYSTPLVIERDGGQVVLAWGADHLTAYHAADGSLLWSSFGFNPKGASNWPSVASPVVAGDVLVVPCGRGNFLAGVRLGGSGNVTNTHRLWTREQLGAFVPTPAVHDGKIYLLGDRGDITCIDPTSGNTLWADALPRHRRDYYASPTIADGKLYAAREDGVVFVARITGQFELLAENRMGEQMIASPVPLANRLFLRGERHLFCVEED